MAGHYTPIVIGVTGHRNIDCTNAILAQQLLAAFMQLKDAYPHSPFLLVSPLAEGADRLVAKTAIKYLSADLIAALPFHEEEYRKDFASAESKAEFDELLLQTKHKYIMPGGNIGEFRTDHPDIRNAQYSRVGAFVSRYAQFVIAIWDGGPAAGKGGTAHIVDWEKSGAIPLDQLHPAGLYFGQWPPTHFGNPLDLYEPGIIIHIPYLNPKEPNTAAHIVGDAVVRYIRDEKEKSVSISEFKFASVPTPARIETLNKGMQLNPAICKCPLEMPPSSLSLPDNRRNDLSQLAEIFKFCDGTAEKEQTASKRYLRAIFWCFIAAVISFSFINLHFAFAIPFLLAFATMIVVSKLAVRSETKESFTDHRLLAEGIRILFYWRIAGITDSVSCRYLPQLLSEIGWVREALSNLEISSGTAFYMDHNVREAPKNADRLMFVRAWITKQKEYYRGNQEMPGKIQAGKKLADALHFIESSLYRTAIGLVLLSVVAWLVYPAMFSPDSLLSAHPLVGDWVKPLANTSIFSIIPESSQLAYFSLVLALIVSVVALMVFRREREALDDVRTHYTYAGKMFDIAEKSLSDGNLRDLPASVLQETIFQIGIVALAEQGNWHSLQKALPLTAPKAIG